jgi:hypothetical protein
MWIPVRAMEQRVRKLNPHYDTLGSDELTGREIEMLDLVANITINRRGSVCTACDSTVDDGICGFISDGSIDRNKTKDYSFLVPLRVVS